MPCEYIGPVCGGYMNQPPFGAIPKTRATSSIDPPSMDTTLSEGTPFVLGARSVDPSGVDTVYIEVLGANLSYLPLPAEGADTFSFAISVPTQGFSGRTVTIGVYGVDVLGNPGPTVERRLTIQ